MNEFLPRKGKGKDESNWLRHVVSGIRMTVQQTQQLSSNKA